MEKKREDSMRALLDDVIQAKAAGLTYGAYKAQQEPEGTGKPAQGAELLRRRKKKYTDREAFALWQAGKSDGEIGAALGVSRQLIQRWRDVLELPSTFLEPDVNTADYQLIALQNGMFVLKKGATKDPGGPGYNGETR